MGKCVGIKKTVAKAVPTWADSREGLFATTIGCMGLNEREVGEDRLAQCPSLIISIEQKDFNKLQPSVKNIIEKVAQNKLAELMAQLAAEGLLGSDSENADTISNMWNKKKQKKIPESVYDKNAEYKARLQALKVWLRQYRGQEMFDIRLAKLPINDQAKWFAFTGPVYVLLQNFGNHIAVHVIFPSMAKDGMQILTYDNLAKSHRWIHRLISSGLYKSKAKCDVPCLGSAISHTKYKYNWRLARCVRKKYYMPCGDAIWPNDDDIKPDTKLLSYTVYAVNPNYPPLKKYFAKSQIQALSRSILPSNWDMYAGPVHMLESENGKWRMMLNGNTLGFYKNGAYRYGIRFSGIGVRATLEEGVLTIYGRSPKQPDEDNNILWSLEIIKGGVPPFALYLENDGQVTLYDGNNEKAKIPAFESALDTTKEGVNYGDYDPNEEYKRRFQHLLDWLRIRGLLKSFVPDIPNVVKYITFEFEDLTPTAPYDENVNYRARLKELLRALQKNFPNVTIPSDDEVKQVLNQTNSKTKPNNVATNEDWTTPYNESLVRADRIRQLKSR